LLFRLSSAAWGRVRQVGYYLRPTLVADDTVWARGCLNEAQGVLFDAMAIADRAHAIRVARRLDLKGAPKFVLEAALLHDCGKPRDYGLLGRVLGVLCSPWPGNLPKSPALTGPKRQLQIYRWHDDWGFDAAIAAGTSPEALMLLAAYQKADSQDSGAPAWLEPLKEADDRG
jgi:hypothetical protein